MKENKVLFLLFAALLLVAFFALQAFNKWKKIIEEYPLLREEQRRFILTEGKISEKAKKELEQILEFDTTTRTFAQKVNPSGRTGNNAQTTTGPGQSKKIAEIKQRFWDVVFSENRDFAIKRLEFLKKSPGYNGILFSQGTLDKWKKENL